MITIKIPLLIQIKIVNSNKDFLLFDLNSSNTMELFKLTNDYKRYINKYKYLYNTTEIKHKINNQKITIKKQTL